MRFANIEKGVLNNGERMAMQKAADILKEICLHKDFEYLDFNDPDHTSLNGTVVGKVYEMCLLLASGYNFNYVEGES